MQIQKDDIRKDILQAAGRLFEERGFWKTSMRDVAEKSGVGLSNIYNYYFRSKDDIFCHIVRPAVNALENMLYRHHGRQGVDIMAMRSYGYFGEVVDEYTSFISRHRKRLYMLFFCSKGSSLEDFRADFTNRATLLVKDYFAGMKQKHPQIDADVTDFSIRMHTVWMFALFEELVMQDIAPGDIGKVVTEYLTIEMAGWRELMKL